MRISCRRGAEHQGMTLWRTAEASAQYREHRNFGRWGCPLRTAPSESRHVVIPCCRAPQSPSTHAPQFQGLALQGAKPINTEPL